MNRALVDAVIKQLGGSENLRDVAEHGADGGFSGFTYYSETVDFWRKNKKLILEALEDLSKDIGEEATEMVKKFKCLDNNYTATEIGKALYGRYDSEYDVVYNALSWFALEEVANAQTK